jgi:hypothetical protein
MTGLGQLLPWQRCANSRLRSLARHFALSLICRHLALCLGLRGQNVLEQQW